MIKEIKKLYDKYNEELKEVRSIQKERALTLSLQGKPAILTYEQFDDIDQYCQFDDIEAELLYMFIREYQPEHMIEFSPMGGWSTSWILEALNRNNKGKCVSYDLVDNSKVNLSKLDLNKERWELVQGDVQQQYSSFDFDSIDFIFIDSDHSTEFAERYVQEVLVPAKESCESRGKKIPVFIHDVFGQFAFSAQEGEVVRRFLFENEIEHITPSILGPEAQEFESIRAEIGLTEYLVHKSTINPVVIFKLGAPKTKPAKKINKPETKYSNEYE